MTIKNCNLSDFMGKALIAMPNMTDERFVRSVIYICSDSKIDGVMGLIVNYPLKTVFFKDILLQMNLSFGEEKFYPPVLDGGPVEDNRGFVLHSSEYRNSDTLLLRDDLALSTSQLALEDLVSGKGPKEALFILGYAKWAPGQLEEEIAQNAWLVSEISNTFIFKEPFEKRWEIALNEMGLHPATLLCNQGTV